MSVVLLTHDVEDKSFGQYLEASVVLGPQSAFERGRGVAATIAADLVTRVFSTGAPGLRC